MPIRIAPISPLNLAAAAALVGSAASAAHAQPPVASYTLIDDGADGTFERRGSGNCVGSSPTQRTVLRAEFAVAPLEGMLIYNPVLFVGFEGAPGTDPQQEYAVSWYIADGVASLEDADAVRTPLEVIDISSGFYPHIIGLMVDTGDGWVENGEDAVAFVLDWGRGHPCADADGSGLVDAQDYWYWFERWGRMDCY